MQRTKIKSFFKKLFKRPFFWVVIVPVLLYNFIFNQFTGQFLFDKTSPSISKGKIVAKVKKFSLLYGIELHDVNLIPPTPFLEKSLFKANRIAILYNIPALFLGRIKISEISIEKPEITILKIDETWNFSAMFPPSPDKKVVETTDSKPLDEINLYIPISAFLNFQIKQLNFTMENNNSKSPLYANINPVDLSFVLDTNRFNKIPLSADAIGLIDRLELILNPKTNINVTVKTKDLEIIHPISLNAKIIKQNSGKELELITKIAFGFEKLIPKRKSKALNPIDFLLSTDLEYLPEGDRIDLKELKLIFGNDKWILADGNAKSVQSKERDLDFSIKESKIDLNKLNKVYKQFPELPDFSFGGILELYPVTVKGKFSSLDANINLKAKDLLFASKNGKSHLVSNLQLKAIGNLDLETEKKEKPYPVLPFVNVLSINPLLVNYNGIGISLIGEYKKEEKIDLSLKAASINVGQFTKAVSGIIDTDVNVKGKNLSNISTAIRLNWRSFQYLVSNSRSNASRLNVNLNGELGLKPNFLPSHIRINSLGLSLKNSSDQEGLKASASGNLNSISPLQMNLDKLSIYLNLVKFIPTLPFKLMEQIANVKNILGSEISLTSKLNIDFSRTMKLSGSLGLIIPGIYLKDFNSEYSIDLDSDTRGSISIPKFSLTAFNSMLKGNISGNLKKPMEGQAGPLGGFIPDLNIDLTLASPTQNEIVPYCKYDGRSGVKMALKDNKAIGNIFSENSNLFFGLKCPGPDCKPFLVSAININLPIEHDITLGFTEKIAEGSKSRFIKNYGQEKPPNFTILKVLGPHPFLEGKYFEYIKPVNNVPAFQGNFEYIRNVFTLNNLKITALNGTIYGKDILFNVGNANPVNMEYSATIQIKDIDLKELLSEKVGKNIDDGKIKADLNLLGKNLSDPLTNTELFFSIYKIGADFGRSAINVVSPPSVLRDFFINRYAVDKVEVELSRGLVYATIDFKSGIMSSLIANIENNRISQERMPLANFLNRANSEISTYR